jgi:hypothetical protein
MCIPLAAVGIIASLAGTAVSMSAAQTQADTSQKIANNNAKMADYAATDAKAKGEEEAIALQRRGASIKSSQRVAQAANGLDLGYGTAADLQDQTDFFSQSDAATARTNAARSAWSTTQQGQDFRTQGAAASYNGGMQATGSLISGAGQVSEKWNAYKKAG